jgi:hypothetical protein
MWSFQARLRICNFKIFYSLIILRPRFGRRACPELAEGTLRLLLLMLFSNIKNNGNSNHTANQNSVLELDTEVNSRARAPASTCLSVLQAAKYFY